MEVEEKYIEAQVGMMSLIGVGKERPCSWGNYFSFSLSKPGDFWGLRCINMWAENLNTARERFLKDGLVKVRVYTENKGRENERQWAIVIDKRIPEDWLYNTCCYTGYARPSEFATARDIYETLGDPNNELEYWTDREMYHAKRCEEIISNTAIRCYERTPEKREELINALLEKRKQND